ncbi:SDR family NAD(P)-dependent oxidoreductase, partial [Micromonospora sp. XM-20-01]|uniref:SDR family NAD(P)-dependent oxidoreductase n=1 Tax=Micromonospora sp. XM-20-01 TaxID=2583240 RepID=UPI0035B46783
MPRVWFITGCSRGLGLALCKLVLDAGESVAATARWSESLQHLLDHYGPERVLTLDLDVNDPSQATEAAQAAKDKFGSIDVLVNNAGYAEVTAIEDSTVQ